MVRLGQGAVLGVEDDPAAGAVLLGEALLEEVEGGLRLGAWDGELVAGGAADGAVRHGGGDGEEEPGAQHPEGVTGAGSTESVEEAGHRGYLRLGFRPRAGG